MRHVRLTCKNHPELRWVCKEIAFSDAGGYNHSRNIFYLGIIGEDGIPSEIMNGRYFEECKCPAADLIRAPEDGKEDKDGSSRN